MKKCLLGLIVLLMTGCTSDELVQECAVKCLTTGYHYHQVYFLTQNAAECHCTIKFIVEWESE